VKRGDGNTNLPELSLAYHRSHFLAATLNFTSFSQWPSLGLDAILQLGSFAFYSMMLLNNIVWPFCTLFTKLSNRAVVSHHALKYSNGAVMYHR